MNVLKKIGDCIFATSYYCTAIILGIVLSISLLTYVSLNIYSNTIQQYSTTQLDWNNVVEDIYSDLRVCKDEINILNETIIGMEKEEEISYKLNIIYRTIEDLDNSMTFGEQYQAYTDLPQIVKSINSISKTVKSEKSSFNPNILDNNKELLTKYNQSALTTNETLNTTFGKLISNIFNLHTWPQVQINY